MKTVSKKPMVKKSVKRSPKAQVKDSVRSASVLKYREILNQSSEELEATEKQYRIEDAKEQLEADIKATDRKVTTLNRELSTLWLSRSLDFSAIIAKETAIESAQAGLNRLKQILAERF